MQALLYNASAGSGKTYKLAYKYVKDVIADPLRYRHILAVTFTNKATEEMKSRILSEINTLARGDISPYMSELKSDLGWDESRICANAKRARGYILHDYSRFTILTIDKFFQRILRAFIQELGMNLNYNIEIESSSILERSADNLIEQITQDVELRRWLTEALEERVDDGCRWDIHEGILSLSGEILKESNHEMLKERLDKEQIKGVVSQTTTRSRKSQEEYAKLGQRAQDIIISSGCDITEFKGKSNSFARKFAKIAQGDTEAPTKTFRDMALDSKGWCKKGSQVECLVPQLLPILQEICKHYDRDVRLWNTAALLKQNYRGFALLGDLYERVKDICQEQGVMLLSETKFALSKFISGSDAPFIYEKTGSRFDRFMIDEFQDTSLKEWGNFLPLLRNAMSQSSETDSRVFIVGDVKQSIYRWRGGDWKILHSLAKQDLGAQSVTVETLRDNYRSLPSVVGFNNSVIESVVENENNFLNNMLEESNANIPLRQELRDTLRHAYTDHAQTPRRRAESDGYVELSTYTSQEPPLKERIMEIIDRGFSPSDIMILTRSNSEGVKVANILLEFKDENTEPRYRFDIMTREALKVGFSPVSRFIIANMKLAINEEDGIQRAIYNNFLGREYFDSPLLDSDIALLRDIRLKSLEESLEQIIIYHRLDEEPKNIAYIQAIHNQLLAFSTSRIADAPLFVEWWESDGADESLSVERSESSIEITTIHKAKGLEKKVVIIPYCNWSLNPRATTSSTVWAHGEQDVAPLGRFPVSFKSAMRESQFSSDFFREMVYSHVDNVNLLYVALTRAKESLHIFVPTTTSSSKKSTNSKVGDVLLNSLPAGANITEWESGVTYSYGVPSAPVHDSGGGEGAQLHIMDRYHTSECRLKLRLPSTKYREDNPQQSGVGEARHVGIMMHKAFEGAVCVDDVYSRIGNMRTNGAISEEEYVSLKSSIDEALLNPTIASWFTPEWDMVQMERAVIIPQSGEIRRPDRVMIKGDRAVVVDYKFGSHQSSAYIKQMRAYMELMLEMGYSQVSGYIWYIKSGEVFEV